MEYLAGESDFGAPRLGLDRRLKMEVRGTGGTSDAGLLVCSELDDVLDLTALTGEMLSEGRRGRDTRHTLMGLLCQSVFGRFAEHEDVSDAESLARDPAVRWVVGGRSVVRQTAMANKIRRFETERLASSKNSAAFTNRVWHSKPSSGTRPVPFSRPSWGLSRERRSKSHQRESDR